MHRRTLLKLAGATAGVALLPGRLLAAGRQHWQNWSGNQQADPRQLLYPASPEALADMLASSTGSVRCFGGSHSFSALVPTEDTLVSLEALAGVSRPDPTANIFQVRAGTRLAMASAEAWKLGLSLANEPDINLQSMAGAIATSTHGSGRQLTSLSGMVESLTLMDANGTTHEISADDGDLFRAAICSLGALGIVTDIRFRAQPAYRLRESSEVMDLDTALQRIDQDKDKYRNIEMFAFPRGGTAILKTMEEVDDAQDIFPEDNSNDLLETVCEVTRHAGWLVPGIQKLLRYFVDNNVKQGPAWRVYGNSRTVRFNEMEYTVPADQGVKVLREVCEAIDRDGTNVMFPIEYRYIAPDNSLIGMFSERPGASISVHQYYKQDYQSVFSLVEPILQKAAGRPHWGKLHTMQAAQLKDVYPHFETFRQIRRELDPQGRFLNAHLRQVLGEK